MTMKAGKKIEKPRKSSYTYEEGDVCPHCGKGYLYWSIPSPSDGESHLKCDECKYNATED